MKKTFLALCLTIVSHNLFAQAQSGTVRVGRAEQPAATIELPYSPEVVKDALNDYLSKKGKSKSTDIKGFTMFRNTQSLTTASDNADLYFRIDRKSRQEKETSYVFLLLTRPEADVAAGKEKHYLNMEQAKTYLNELAPAIEAYNLELNIKEQNKTVIKAESLYKTQLDNGADLEKRRTDLEARISDNKAEQQKLLGDVDAQKQKLTTLINQRKP